MLLQKPTSYGLKMLAGSIFLFLIGVMAVVGQTSGIGSVAGPFFIILLAMPSFYAMYVARRLDVLLYIALLGFIMEGLSIHTGFPYGFFEYGSLMGPTLAGVPFLLAFAWPPLVIGAYAVMQRSSYAVVGTTVFLLLLDLVLDPVAVILGQWDWAVEGIYYGIPFQNFLGWTLTGLIASLLIEKVDRLPSYSASSLLFVVAFWTGAAVISQLALPAFFGILVWSVTFAEILNDDYVETHKSIKE